MKKKNAKYLSGLLAVMLSLVSGLSGMPFSGNTITAEAANATLTGEDATVSVPSFNRDNYLDRPAANSTKVFYYGGNAFYSFDKKSADSSNISDWANKLLLVDTDASWDGSTLKNVWSKNSYTTTYDAVSSGGVIYYADSQKSKLNSVEQRAVSKQTVTTLEESELYSGYSAESGSPGYSFSDATLFPVSKHDYEQNQTLAGNIYSAHGSYVWSRSFSGVNYDRSAWNVNNSSGDISDNNVNNEFGVAPAFYLDLSKVVMARSAQTGASASASNGSVAAYNPDISGDVKFLIQNSSFAPSFTSSISQKASSNIVGGKTYTVDYKNATVATVETAGTDAALFISAAIYDEDGKIVYYSPVKELTIGTGDTSGTFDFTIPSDITAGDTYTLAIFEEQISGTTSTSWKLGSTSKSSVYETDYMSNGVAYMSMTIAANEFTVTADDGTYLHSGKTYTKSEIADKVTAAIDGTEVSTDKWYVMTKEDYDKLSSVTYSTVTAADGCDSIVIEQNTGTESVQLPLVFIYFEDSSSTAQIVNLSMEVIPHVLTVSLNEADSYLYSGRTYTVKEISQYVTVKIDSTVLAYSDYYVMTKDDFDALSADNLTYSYINTHANSIKIDQISGNEGIDLDLEFIYFLDNETPYYENMVISVVADEIQNEYGFDSKTWYSAEENGITWNYKLNGSGDIIGLYTLDAIPDNTIIDSGYTLNVPSKVAGRTVTAIGGGTEDTPFIPSSVTGWQYISFPSSVSVINDYAFYKNGASSNIVIPSTISAIGIRAFQYSSIFTLKINDMSGTIGSLAFADTSALTTVYVKGAGDGLVISTIAFRESNGTSVSLIGNITVNKNAFKNNTRIQKLYLSGVIDLQEYAFTGCTALSTLSFNNTVSIGSYAFNGATALQSVYLPNGTTVAAYAFNNCTNLATLESDVDLVNHSFEGCNKIDLIILDSNVSVVEYDWEGHTGTYSTRHIYIKNKDTQLQIYTDGTSANSYSDSSTNISMLGSSGSGDVSVYFLSGGTNLLAGVDPDDEGILTLNAQTCYANQGTYKKAYTGMAKSVTFTPSNNIDTKISEDNIVTQVDTESKVTAISAYYDDSVLTTQEVKKDSMTVVPVYDSLEGSEALGTDEFYIVRTEDFNTLEGNDGGLTEEAVAACEPVTAVEDDLFSGESTGSLSVTVVVFHEDAQESVNKAYFSTPVTIHVEEYTAQGYVEKNYGSYENFVSEMESLVSQIETLKKQISDFNDSNDTDVEELTELINLLSEYKKNYEDLLDRFADYVSSTTSDSNGYTGTITTDDGETKDVIYINGTASEYTDTGKTTESGEKIYTASYDSDGDGTAEQVYVYVGEDGVHIVDRDGNETGTVYKDTIGSLQRKVAAQLQEVESTLDTCKEGIRNVISALKDAGYDIDVDLTLSEQYEEIVKAIQSMAKKIDDLENDLKEASSNSDAYENALASIYALLTNSTLDKDNIEGVDNTLSAITTKIKKLVSDLEVANANVTDLKNQLNQAETQASALANELESTKTSLSDTQTALDQANSDKADLVAAYEKAIAEGDEESAALLQEQIDKYNATISELESTQETLKQKEQDIKDAQDALAALKEQLEAKEQELAELKAQVEALSDSAEGLTITVDTANKLFGLSLSEDATDTQIYEEIQNYVKQKLTSDETIAQIQKLVNSTNTGSDLVADVSDAISSGTSSSDDVVNTDSQNYKTGYSAGYSAGKTEGYNTGKAEAQDESYQSGYDTGYSAGYAKGVEDEQNTSSDSNSTDSETVSKLTSQIASLTETNASLSSQVSILTSKVSTLESTNSTLTSENSTLKAANETLTSENSSLESKNETLTTKNSSLTSKNKTLKSTNSDLNDKISELESMNDELNDKIKSLNSSNSSLSSENSSLKNTNSSLNTENSNLKSTNTALQTENTNLKNSASTAKSSTTATVTPATTASATDTKTTASSTTANSSAAASKTDDDKSKDNDADKTKDNDKSDEEEDELEGSTQNGSSANNTLANNKVNSTIKSETEDSSKVKLGDTVSIRKPSNSQGVNSAQKAKSIVTQEDELALITSNGKNDSQISDESLNNIMSVVDYYSNNLDALSGLGYEDIDKVVSDETKAVTIDVVAAGDIKPSASQEAQMRSGTDVKVNVSYDGIDNEGMYLIVHESSKRSGMYDVVLENPSSGTLEFSVTDLSPVAIAKVTVSNVATANGSLETVADTMDQQKNSKGMSAMSVIIILLLIALIVGGIVLLLIKLDRDGKIKLPRLMP